jgi:tRNA(fMet)-specific endonuclease VapC
VKYLLDTSVCVELIRGRALRWIKQMAKRPTSDFALSTITVAELQYGAERSARPPHQRQTLEKFLVPFAVLAFDFDATAAYGKIRVELETSGAPIGALDMLIAAHAVSRNLVLLTRNLKEFKRVPGLKAEDWTKARTEGDA